MGFILSRPQCVNEISIEAGLVIPLTGDESYNHFAALSIPPKLDNVNFEYEAGAVAFLERYAIEGGEIIDVSDIESSIVKDNFTMEEIWEVIDSLTKNKAPGIDSIPAEFICYYKEELVPIITSTLNYVIEQK